MEQAIFVQVQRVRKLNDRVHEYELICPDGTELPAYAAGAHIELRLPEFGARHYSLVRAWSPASAYVIAVQREDAGRGGSAWLHDNLEPGAMLEISPPRNHFALRRDEQKVILIGGGIGITPIWAMAQELTQRGTAFELVVCARDSGRLLYGEELSLLQAQGRATLLLSDGKDGRLFDFDRHFAQIDGGAAVYCCGPASLMGHVRLAASRRAGVAVYTEAFSATPPPADQPADAAFVVRCAASGLLLDVPPEQSMLDVLLAAGVDVVHSCREGYCGTCITRLKDGYPVHRDTCLGPDDRSRYIAVCISRAEAGTELILDL